MKTRIRKILVVIFLLFSLQSMAQEKQKITEQDYTNDQVEMADTLRADGKIYVVVAVVIVILSGLIMYTVSIDRKINKVEKELGIK